MKRSWGWLALLTVSLGRPRGDPRMTRRELGPQIVGARPNNKGLLPIELNRAKNTRLE